MPGTLKWMTPLRLRRKRRPIFAPVWVGLYFAAGALAAAHERGTDERPRIGIALGGGSARGFAHIGVLEWLEEHRIPVDLIVGTSMGGLIGGTYATGISAKELRRFVGDIDWDRTFLGETPYELQDFRRKQDHRDYPVRLELGLRGGLGLPSGLDPGHQVGLILSRVGFPYSGMRSFDDLPIAFRSVAVDLEKAEVVILGEGSLSRAMRATMSIPGVFPPFEWEGRLLIDGGVLNNVPADVARSLGADVVLAVDVGTPLRDRSELRSALSYASQAIDAMMAHNTQQALEQADFVVRPVLDGVGSLDWRASDSVADRGHAAMESMAPALAALAVSEEAWTRYLAERGARKRSSTLAPQFLRVEGVGTRGSESIARQLRGNVGKPVDLDALETDLTAVTGSGRYESLSYEFLQQGDSDGLLIRAREKSYGPPFLHFSLEVRNEASGIDFRFRTRMTAFDVGGYGSETRLDLEVGSALGLGLEHYLPFGGSRWFVAPRASLSRNSLNSFRDGSFVATYHEKRVDAGGDFGYTFGRRGEIRFGYDIAEVRFRRDIGDPILPELEGTEETGRVQWIFDDLDSATIPTRGLRAVASYRYFFQAPAAMSRFRLAEASLSAFQPLGSKDRLWVRVAGGTSFDDLPPAPYQFTLGGPLRLSAFDTGRFRADHFLLGSAGWLRTVGRLPDFVGGAIYLTGLVETGSAFDAFETSRSHTSVTLGLLMDTALGPLFLGGSVAEEGSSRVYFSLGRLFR